MERFRFLKMCLDPAFHASFVERDLPWAPRDQNEVDDMIKYYLGELYTHIREAISTANHWTLGAWDGAGIEFAFSVPTTWEDSATVDRFESIIRAAGFGAGKRHAVVLSLTEPEAAAIHFMCGPGKSRLQPGHILLTIDAGGGTTDLALVRVVSVDPPILEQVHQVLGTGIGSMQIDLAFKELVSERLKRHPGMARLLPPNLDAVLAQSRSYISRKHGLGRSERDQEGDLYRVEIPGVHWDFTCAELGIESGHLVVARWVHRQPPARAHAPTCACASSFFPLPSSRYITPISRVRRALGVLG
jgi:hypothetical protein